MNEGVEVIKKYVRNLPGKPGVYRMMDAKESVLYVGKAKSLRNRVANYTNLTGLPYRIARMVSETRSMEFITTHTEVEALLLEANMIKRLKPAYNILLRDDKSFPYILIETDHPAPQVRKHRGAKNRQGHYFGPFASVRAVNQSLHILQKAFLLRTCSDSVYNSRTRPCLLYQIKRCAAPCVEKISLPDYQKLVSSAHDFLSGKSLAIKGEFTQKMEQASAAQDYETAALYRDRLRALAAVQLRQSGTEDLEEADIIAGYQQGGQTCIQVFFFRAGQNWGNKAYFPRHHKEQEIDDVLPAFISQFYDNKPPPRLILVSSHIKQRALLEEALAVKAEHRVKISFPQRGAKFNMVQMVEKNAREALGRRLAEKSSQKKLLEGVAEKFDLDAPPRRIEIYDNSHISGTHALGAMVVAGPEGFDKSSYRKFNIKSTEITPGDDFGMMREVMTRRFKRQLREDPDRTSATWPDLLIIDGGKGQLSAVRRILADLGLEEDVPVVSIAKGPDRNAGREDFYLPDQPPFRLPQNDPLLYFLQRLRDEAHRFAIGGHRQQRAKNMQKSILDGLPGIGPGRKKALLLHFGSAKAVEGAALTDLEAVPGISGALARKIYDYFHDDG